MTTTRTHFSFRVAMLPPRPPKPPPPRPPKPPPPPPPHSGHADTRYKATCEAAMAAFAPQVVAVQFNEVEGVEEDALLVMADEVERGNAVCRVVDTVGNGSFEHSLMSVAELTDC